MVLEPQEPYFKIIKKSVCQIKNCTVTATRELGCLRVCWNHYKVGTD